MTGIPRKAEILKLRAEGKSYREIVKITGCCRSNVAYHCGNGQKEKHRQRCDRYKNESHPFCPKIERFCIPYKPPKGRNPTSDVRKLLYLKIVTFSKVNNVYQKIEFTPEDVINKVGENPKCYLTGRDIDIQSPRTYHFDHIVPRSKGGPNTIENLGITTSAANLAKGDMKLEEFIELCKDVCKNNGYTVSKISDNLSVSTVA